MYTREGSPDPTVMDQVFKTMFAVPDDQAMADLEGAISFLKGPVRQQWAKSAPSAFAPVAATP